MLRQKDVAAVAPTQERAAMVTTLKRHVRGIYYRWAGIMFSACQPAPKPMLGASAEVREVWIGLTEHLGDIVACGPIASYLKECYPGAIVVWVTQGAYLEVATSTPDVDRVIVVECLRQWVSWRDEAGKGVVIVDLHVSRKRCSHCGYKLKKSSGNLRINRYNYGYYGSLLSAFSQAAGLPALANGPRLVVGRHIEERIAAVGLPTRFMVIHRSGGGRGAEKEWGWGQWRALASAVYNESGIETVEIGAEGDKAVCPPLCPGTPLHDLRGRLTIMEAAAVIRKALLFVGIDSGPSHLANAVGTPGILLLGELPPFGAFMPFSGGYAGLNATRIYHRSLVRQIPYERVYEAVLRRLAVS